MIYKGVQTLTTNQLVLIECLSITIWGQQFKPRYQLSQLITN